MSVLEKAMLRLKGYCLKQVGCEKCRFKDDDGYCIFHKYIPADWEIPKKEG